MFSTFTLAIKFDCIFFTIFQSFYLFVSFILNKLPPLNIRYVSKDVLNHNLVHSSTFNDLKSAKNVVFFSFCILVNMPMGEGLWPTPGYATEVNIVLKYRVSTKSLHSQELHKSTKGTTRVPVISHLGVENYNDSNEKEKANSVNKCFNHHNITGITQVSICNRFCPCSRDSSGGRTKTAWGIKKTKLSNAAMENRASKSTLCIGILPRECSLSNDHKVIGDPK